MKMKVNPQEKFVGLFVFFALILLIIVIIYNKQSTHDEDYLFRSIIQKTYGLLPDDKVKIQGIVVGKVFSIDILRDKKTKKQYIELFLAINEEYLYLIKRDASITIEPALASEGRSGSGLSFLLME